MLSVCPQAEKKAKQREKEKERKRAAAEKKAKAAEGARAAAEAEVTTAAAEAAALAARYDICVLSWYWGLQPSSCTVSMLRCFTIVSGNQGLPNKRRCCSNKVTST